MLRDEVWERYLRHQDPRDRAELLSRNLGLVHFAAHEMRRRTGSDADLDDMVGAGMVGLVQAVDGFEPQRGRAFSTYAMKRIRGAILDEMRRLDWMPRSLRGWSRRLARARAEMERSLGRPPDEAELAGALDTTVKELRARLVEIEPRPVLRLDQPVAGGDHDALRLAETIPDAGEAPEASLTRDQEVTAMRAAFDRLLERDRLVLSLYYYEELTLREIGEVLHVSESRVSQIHTRALRRLREAVELDGENQWRGDRGANDALR